MLYLASTSPRRLELLAAAGIAYVSVAPGPEPRAAGSPADRARQRAASKALGARPEGPGLVLGADTVVELEGEELGKPADAAAARRALTRLSGRVHRVCTALCLVTHPGRARLEDSAVARVRCRELAPAEIEAYVESGAWRGKAGGYGLQDDACDFMELVEGEADTVIGLPLATLRRLLERASGAAR